MEVLPMQTMEPHCIYADDRERPSGIPEILRERFRMSVVESRLPFGDYWLGSGIMVERKTLEDFALSIIDGRLFRQIQRMKQLTDSSICSKACLLSDLKRHCVCWTILGPWSV